jgi:VanZ family protein
VIAFAALILPGTLLYLRSLIWLIPAALAFGAAIELVRPLVGRSAEVTDFMADVVGVACGLALGLIVRMSRIKSLNGQKARTQLARSSR